MIRIRDLNKSYEDGHNPTPVLQDVNLEIEAGQFVSIVGTSGSGKTTLLNIIGGLDRDYSGEVSVDGRELQGLGEREMARLRNETFGFVFQQFNLLDHLTVEENVALPGFFSARDTSSGQRGQRGQSGQDEGAGSPEALLARVGLEEKIGEYPNRLSGGQQQRVAIARALYGRPRNMLCDEPTGNLDRRTGLQVMELFQTLNREEEITLIMVTHEEHIARMSDRIVRLEDGRVISDEANEPVEPSEHSAVHTSGAVDGEVDGAVDGKTENHGREEMS